MLLSLSCVNANLIGSRISTSISPVKRHTRCSPLLAGESVMASNSLRVAAAQMTSINDLAANFATCSRLVKVFHLFLSKVSFFLSPFNLSHLARSPFFICNRVSLKIGCFICVVVVIIIIILYWLFEAFCHTICLQRKQHQLEQKCFAFLKPSLMWVSRMGTVPLLLNLWTDHSCTNIALWPGSHSMLCLIIDPISEKIVICLFWSKYLPITNTSIIM